MKPKAIQFFVLLLAMTATGWAHSRVPHSTAVDRGEDFIPTPKVAQTMAFGFDALLADYHWLQAVQIAGGDNAIGPDEARQLGQLVDVVTTLNPHVGHPYRFAAIWLTHDPQQVREGIRLLERAVEYHPDDWRNYFYIGFNHFFYLGEFEEAAAILEQALDKPERPAYLQRLVARLKSQKGGIDVAEVFLRELLRGSQDEEEKAKLQIALDEIEIEHKARFLDRARAAYRELSGREITSIEDLTRGQYRVIERLPDPEPDAMPRSLSRGSVWEIDFETDRIQSTYLGSRYEVHQSHMDRERRESWQRSDPATEPGAQEELNGNG